jgi:hypothetical protein
MSAPASADARRGEHFRTQVKSRGSVWAILIGTAAAIVAGGAMHEVRIALGGPVVVVLLVVLAAYRTATARAENDFFAALAPTLGLTYMVGGGYRSITPLLAAGDRQRFEHTMEGSLFGRRGGPPCVLAHYTYDTHHQARVGNGAEVDRWTPHPFTVVAIDLGAPLARFRGLYLRRRISALGLEHDWLDRAPKPRAIELESERFNAIYELRAAVDQDELAVRELFSPSLVMWLVENPLHPGFECKAGTLCVFVPGHEGSAGRITMLHEAARELAQRLGKQVAESALAGGDHFSAAGHTIR